MSQPDYNGQRTPGDAHSPGVRMRARMDQWRAFVAQGIDEAELWANGLDRLEQWMNGDLP
ncbi:hypothetical protein [Nocardia concava]|uniref:hypothetical protein n=1 Tax=Nocardia concava TaxID=257281 RepID=UPI00031A137C|nr:hypothetical protein [Nocardia concava]